MQWYPVSSLNCCFLYNFVVKLHDMLRYSPMLRTKTSQWHPKALNGSTQSRRVPGMIWRDQIQTPFRASVLCSFYNLCRNGLWVITVSIRQFVNNLLPLRINQWLLRGVESQNFLLEGKHQQGSHWNQQGVIPRSESQVAEIALSRVRLEEFEAL